MLVIQVLKDALLEMDVPVEGISNEEFFQYDIGHELCHSQMGQSVELTYFPQGRCAADTAIATNLRIPCPSTIVPQMYLIQHGNRLPHAAPK